MKFLKISAYINQKHDRKAILEQKKSNEKDAIIIYLKQGRSYGVKTDEAFELIKGYLLSIYS